VLGWNIERLRKGLNGSGLNTRPPITEATAVFFNDTNNPLLTKKIFVNFLKQKKYYLHFKEAKKKAAVNPICPIFL